MPEEKPSRAYLSPVENVMLGVAGTTIIIIFESAFSVVVVVVVVVGMICDILQKQRKKRAYLFTVGEYYAGGLRS
jgi:hypothetical protein